MKDRSVTNNEFKSGDRKKSEWTKVIGQSDCDSFGRRKPACLVM
jgi:hypothetical protein